MWLVGGCIASFFLSAFEEDCLRCLAEYFIALNSAENREKNGRKCLQYLHKYGIIKDEDKLREKGNTAQKASRNESLCI